MIKSVRAQDLLTEAALVREAELVRSCPEKVRW